VDTLAILILCLIPLAVLYYSSHVRWWWPLVWSVASFYFLFVAMMIAKRAAMAFVVRSGSRQFEKRFPYGSPERPIALRILSESQTPSGVERKLQKPLAKASNSRGLAHYAKGDVEGALQDYNEAIRLNPEYAEAYNHRGVARYAKGDMEGALQDYNEAIRLKPDYVKALNNRGVARQSRRSDFSAA